jgi:hypothetical protein
MDGYSPNVGEGVFSEVRIQDFAYNVARKPRRRLLRHLAPREGRLHVVVVNKDPEM